MVLSLQDRNAKLAKLVEIEGFVSVDALLEHCVISGECHGICTDPDCSYTNTVEGDQEEGWCEACDANTVQSALVLAQII